jgi:predicted MFS family arabinose efflux permease
VLSKRHGLSSGTIGLLIAGFGATALAGSLVAPRVARLLSIRTIMLVNQWGNGLVLVYLLKPTPYVLFASVLPVAFLSPALNSVVIGYRTAVTPDHLIGRVSSVARNLALLAQPLGPLVAGLLLGAYSGRLTILVLGGICVALAIASTLSPSIRNPPSLAELDELPVRPTSAIVET